MTAVKNQSGFMKREERENAPVSREEEGSGEDTSWRSSFITSLLIWDSRGFQFNFPHCKIGMNPLVRTNTQAIKFQGCTIVFPGWACIPAGCREERCVCRPTAVLQLLKLCLQPARRGTEVSEGNGEENKDEDEVDVSFVYWYAIMDWSNQFHAI